MSGRRARRPNFSDAELLADIRLVYEESGRLTMTAYEHWGTHSLITLRGRFGSWERTIERAGLLRAYKQTHGRLANGQDETSLALAEARAFRATRRIGREIRWCLKCAQRFHSTGAGNRLCTRCLETIDREGLADGLAVGMRA